MPVLLKYVDIDTGNEYRIYIRPTFGSIRELKEHISQLRLPLNAEEDHLLEHQIPVDQQIIALDYVEGGPILMLDDDTFERFEKQFCTLTMYHKMPTHSVTVLIDLDDEELCGLPQLQVVIDTDQTIHQLKIMIEEIAWISRNRQVITTMGHELLDSNIIHNFIIVRDEPTFQLTERPLYESNSIHVTIVNDNVPVGRYTSTLRVEREDTIYGLCGLARRDGIGSANRLFGLAMDGEMLDEGHNSLSECGITDGSTLYVVGGETSSGSNRSSPDRDHGTPRDDPPSPTDPDATEMSTPSDQRSLYYY